MQRWPGLVLVLVVHLSVAVQALRADRYLHDEGLLTHLFAGATARDPLAVLFLQKSRPPISALYAGFADHSLDAFFGAHIVVAAGGVVLLWMAARALHHRAPVLVAAVLATSPLYLGGAVAGLSNTDVVVGLCGWAWLRARERPVVAAAVLGILPWIRAEVAVLAVWVAVDAIRRRDLRVLGALIGFGLLYGLAGIGYHHDPIWFLHYPPALPDAMPGNPYWEGHSGATSVSDLVATAVALTPMMPALALVPWRRLTATERLGLGFVVTFTVALVVLPMGRVFNFDQSPRYLLPVVPFVALAGGRVFDRWLQADAGGRAALAGLVVVAGLAGWGAMEAPHATALAAVGVVAAALTSARAGYGTAAVAVLVALVLAGPAAFADGGHVDRRSTAPHLGPMVDRLEEFVGDRARVVYTNEPLLAVFLRRTGRLPRVQVFYIVQEDQRFELERLANPHNGQREALWRAFQGSAYGRPIRPGALRPDTVAGNAVFALTKDERLSLVMPPQRWEGQLDIVHPGYGMFIAERRSEGER